MLLFKQKSNKSVIKQKWSTQIKSKHIFLHDHWSGAGEWIMATVCNTWMKSMACSFYLEVSHAFKKRRDEFL